MNVESKKSLLKNKEESEEVAICRACICECSVFKPLHIKGIIAGELTSFADMLSYISGLDFSDVRLDVLSTQICVPCVKNLVKAFSFKKKVLQTQESLYKQLLDTMPEDLVQHQQLLEGEEEIQEFSNEEQLTETLDDIDSIQLVTEDEETENENTLNFPVKEEEETMEIVEVIAEDVIEQEEYHVLVSDHFTTVQQENGFEIDTIEEHLESVDAESEIEIDDSIAERRSSTDSARLSSDSKLLNESQNEADNIYSDYVVNVNKESYLILSDETVADSRDNEKIEQTALLKPFRRRKMGPPKPPNPDLQCKVCGKQLSNSNSFKYHMQLHSDATPFLCSLCGEGFKTRNAYDGHLSLHNPNNPNTCTVCGKSYRQLSSLRSHMLVHTGERPFQCNICGKGCTQKSGFKKHMLTHTGEKPHSCDICFREFRYSSNLITHKRCHTGEKPYNCDKCGKNFASSEQLKRHTLVHTVDRPFSCEKCGKRFKRRTTLNSHRHTHSRTSPVTEYNVDAKSFKSKIVEVLA